MPAVAVRGAPERITSADTLSVKVRRASDPAASTTINSHAYRPAADGMPASSVKPGDTFEGSGTPSAADDAIRLNPGGSGVPGSTLQAYGGTPPLAFSAITVL